MRNQRSFSLEFKHRVVEERMEAEADLRGRIEAICIEYPRYGYRRVTHELKHRSCHVNHKKVLRIMHESDLCAG